MIDKMTKQRRLYDQDYQTLKEALNLEQDERFVEAWLADISQRRQEIRQLIERLIPSPTH